MGRTGRGVAIVVLGCLLGLVAPGASRADGLRETPALDGLVMRFLRDTRDSWADLNVPYEDGKRIHDLVLKGNFTHILEIGTSTGYSTIWLAWAAAKTGGRVTTIEVDRGRHERALENFKRAGVAPYIDARLADAHVLVPLLQGPFDFVFSDADKEWYLQYFLDLKSKVSPGGCFTAHNALGGGPGVKRFLDYVKRDPHFRTSVERGSGEGISISCKISD